MFLKSLLSGKGWLKLCFEVEEPLVMRVQPVLGRLFILEINMTDIHKGDNGSDSYMAGIVLSLFSTSK
jgi:hypothetical protein